MTTVIDVREAVGLVRDGATVVIGGSGAGHALPQLFIDELAAVYEEQDRPRDLTTVRVVGIGDFADRGFSQLGLPGLMKRTIGSNIGNEPRLGALVEHVGCRHQTPRVGEPLIAGSVAAEVRAHVAGVTEERERSLELCRRRRRRDEDPYVANRRGPLR